MLNSIILFLILTCQTPREHPAQIQVYFSPGGRPTAAIVSELEHAQRSVMVQAYSFTSKPIADALVKAHRRGVNVRVIVDRGQPKAKGGKVWDLVSSGVQVWVDRAHAIAHNKVIIIDGSTVVTGSFNFTVSAETRNAENLLVIRDAEVSRLYADNWERCLAHSERMAVSAAL